MGNKSGADKISRNLNETSKACAKNKDFNYNLAKRVISACILIPAVLFAIYKGGIFFDTMVMVFAICMAFEWNEITKVSVGFSDDGKSDNRLSNRSKLAWKMLGVVYISLPCISLVWIIDQLNGDVIITWLFITVWVADISAFFCGKIIGGLKLAKKISPNKTWSGFLGSLVAAAVFGMFASRYIYGIAPTYLAAVTVVVAVFAQVGDLFESWVKRKFYVKDSGSIIPGHGGILDRVDGMMIATPVLAIVKFFCDTCLL